MKKLINWKLYFILLGASVLSIIAVLPYAFTLTGEIIQQAPVPFPVLVIASILQSSFLFAVVLFFGLRLAKKVGLNLPFIEACISKEKTSLNITSILKPSIALGLASGISIILVDFFFTEAGVGISLWIGEMPPMWMGFLASFYGGFAEEILLRLFFMTLLVWLFSKCIKPSESIIQNSVLMWVSIVLATVLFGLGHLPVTASVTALTPLVVTRAIVLNGIGGVVFGWLYWKKGLESAMIAHFSADIVLHVLFPLLLPILIFGN